MSSIDVVGVGNPVVDVTIHREQDYLEQHGFEKGSSQLIEAARQALLLQGVNSSEETISSGGSVSNSIDGIRKLGGEVTLAGKVGSDRYGEHFLEELRRDGVLFGSSFQVEGETATSFVIVTPDGERTMRTSLGVTAELSPGDVDSASIRSARWLFIEGYVLPNGDSSQEAVRYALQEAKKAGTKIAITLASEQVVENYRGLIEEIISDSHLIIGNEKEAMALTGRPTFESAFDDLRGSGTDLAISAGPNGVFTRFDNRESHVLSFNINQIVSATGAGDSMAGGLLFGLSQGISPETSALGGCYIASKVLQQDAARLSKTEMEDAWRAISSASPSELRSLGWKG